MPSPIPRAMRKLDDLSAGVRKRRDKNPILIQYAKAKEAVTNTRLLFVETELECVDRGRPLIGRGITGSSAITQLAACVA